MPSIYLDYASTTPCDPRVREAMLPYFFDQAGNASSPHRQGRRARKAIEEARELTAGFLGAAPLEIIFTSGASESNNQAVLSAVRRAVAEKKGKHIVVSAIEHHSVLEPVQRLRKLGLQVSLVEPSPDGIVRVQDIKSCIQEKTILVCLMHANNEIGTLQPVQEIGHLCRERDICFLVDATQTVGHIPVNVKDISCDFLSFSAHKFYGPQGVGALYVRQGIECKPFILGGDQERGRRAGTHNLAGIVGLGHAIKLAEVESVQQAQREKQWGDKIIDEVLKEIPGVILNGHRENRLPNNVHFSFEGINGEELVSALDLAGYAVSVGSACTWGRIEPSHVLKAIGLSDAMALGSLRVTLGRWSSEEGVYHFLKQLKLKVQQLR